MKKLLLSFAVLVACATTTRAQDSDNSFGIKAGASLTSFVGKDVSSSASYLFGFNGGLVANIKLSERLSVQPELLYSMKGAKDKMTLGTTTLTGTQRLHYIDVPILLKAKFGQVFVEAGPQAGVLVRANAKFDDGSSNSDVANKDAFNLVDFGYVAGLGYQSTSGPMVGVRYNGGFTNVDQSNVVNGQSIQAKARNSAFQLYVGYMFGGK